MNNLSPAAQKAVEEAAGRHNALTEWHEQGPHLKNGYIIVPSVRYHPKVTETLKAQGFVFSPCDYYPQWERWCSLPAANGKKYTPEQWLTSCRKLYKEVWGINV